jgi:hypothetical protein
MALAAFKKSYTNEQAVHCVNLILMTMFAMESFSLEEESYVSFQLLKENVKMDFANTIKNRFIEFLDQAKPNTFRIPSLFFEVIF